MLRAADVGCVYLVHGTFVGDDLTGATTVVARFAPGWGDTLRRGTKRVVDFVFGDCGNYPPDYAARFEQALNAAGGPHIPVVRFSWSGENHHVARADAAVRLIHELSRLELPAGKRLLIWGHSHGGNVLALTSSLLADAAASAAFFAAARSYYRRPVSGRSDMPVWERVERLLERPRPILPMPLDLVTFGTPIRYGWNPAAYDKLLHFVNHRPRPGRNEYQAPPPRSIREIWRGEGGDYTQQFGIAGSNVPPLPLFYRSFLADRRLCRLLQPDCYSIFSFFRSHRCGRRVPDAGRTLLVDYGPPAERNLRTLTGHMQYTQRKWLPFHAAEVARRLYTDPA